MLGVPKTESLKVLGEQKTLIQGYMELSDISVFAWMLSLKVVQGLTEICLPLFFINSFSYT